MESPNKGRIAKNTIFLYFRMFLVMGVSLFTSRIVLEKLGVDNFGIYQTVGGVVGLMSFINSTLSTGTSRFITFELGRGNRERLARTFSTTLSVQFILVGIIVLLCETIGLWFVNHKLQIPQGSMYAAVAAYHISILTTAVSLIQVPFTSAIIAHERMNMFAYLSIFDVCAKLGIVYLLSVGHVNRLILYATLLLLVQTLVTSFYVIYCLRHFPETHYKILLDKPIFKEIAGFSGWSLFAATSIALNNQGVLVLLNMFFSPVVVAARAISIQVNNAANQFVANFRTAVNPQIVKQYAAGHYDDSKALLLSSAKYGFYLMFMLSLPICMCASPLLHVWLTEVPQYSVVFLQLVVIQSLFQVFDTSFYTALFAKGDLRLNALISPTLGFIMFPIVYLMFRMGCSPVALSWASLIMYAMLGMVVKPILIIKIVNYTWKDIIGVYRPCFTVAITASILSLIATHFIQLSGWAELIIKSLICLIITVPTIYLLGLTPSMRTKLNTLIQSKLHVQKA